MGDETTTLATRPNATSTSYSGSDAVRAVLAALIGCWPNAKFDRTDKTGVWGNAIGGLVGDQIRHGIRQLSVLSASFPPSPGEFRALCLTYKPVDVSPPRPQLRDDSAKGRAWRATQAAFAVKVCGVSPPGEIPSTEFDVEYVVANTAKPTSSALIEHEFAWRKLKENFEREWVRR